MYKTVSAHSPPQSCGLTNNGRTCLRLSPQQVAALAQKLEFMETYMEPKEGSLTTKGAE